MRAVNTLAVGGKILEGKLSSQTFCKLLPIETDLVIALDYRDIVYYLCICRDLNDCYICTDVSVIRY